MKAKTVNKFFLLLLAVIILIPILIPFNLTDENRFLIIKDKGIYSSKADNTDKKPKSSGDPFQLTQEFTPSSYYISPESSPGYKDDLFFSFEANRNGNYTIEIENVANCLTKNIEGEMYTSFDNPTSTNLYYLSYIEYNIYDFSKWYIKLLKSSDKGQNWDVETISTVQSQGDNAYEVLYTTLGSIAVAADPYNGTIGIITYYNDTELVYIGSEDNGTTWSDRITITTTKMLGFEPIGMYGIIGKYGSCPNIELGILKNGTIYALSEANNNSYTSIVYFKSNDNGSTWTGPKNITILEGFECYKPKLQVDLVSGNYWLTYKVDFGTGKKVSWAEFSYLNSLSSNVAFQDIASIGSNNYDFYYDKNNGLFRLIVNKNYEIFNCTTPNFGQDWTNTSFGSFKDMDYGEGLSLDIVHDGETYQFFFIEQLISNYYDVYQYIHMKNPTFWINHGNFTAGEFIQVNWNGKMNDIIPINRTHVMVNFTARNGTGMGKEITKTLYIEIDNKPPSFETFYQKLNYFNPAASNFSFSEILWDLLPSESSQVNLEIFTENSFESEWVQITNNNWHDLDPKIFSSNTGQLYALYPTDKFGRNYICASRSLDNGITWSSPVEIWQGSSTPKSSSYYGVAYGDMVVLLLQGDGFKDLYRSFDKGMTWQDPINIHDQLDGYIRDAAFTSNGTMYIATIFHDFNTQYLVYESTDFGLNWTFSAKWIEASDFPIQNNSPKLAYDSTNELLHILMPIVNFTQDFIEQYAFINLSFSTLNFSTKTWSERIALPLAQVGGYTTENANLIITKENPLSPVVLRAIYPYLTSFSQGKVKVIRREFNSTDNGQTWNGPYESSIGTDYINEYTTEPDYNIIYYLTSMSDGNDNEIYFSRKGRLIKSKLEFITSNNISEFDFDGIDDFGNYIDNGNYTYSISLSDFASNQIDVNGWFYADYNATQITDYTTNWAVSPTPRYDVTVSAKITDETNFTAYLYYRKNNGDWQKRKMMNESGIFSATIPGDSVTSKTEYYIKTIDIAGNEIIFDNNGDYFVCDMPNYIWDSEGLFKETKSYSSSDSYELTVTILGDLEYVREVIFRYSYDEGDEWDDLELEQSSPEFEGKLDDIPEDLKELYYKIVIVDIFGNEVELTETQKVDFYPEVPSLELNPTGMGIAGLISATMGILLAIGYIKLKKTSHETIQKQMFYKKYKKTHEDVDKTFIKKDIAPDVEGAKEFKIAAEFTYTYLGILFSTIALLIVGSLISGILSLMAIYLIAGSLIMAVFGYMILMSRDIKLNIYKEEINKKNFIFEGIQVALMFIIIMMMLLVGNTIPWFRYYLIESTFDIGTASIPTLYLSVIAVFLTSLVLVIFSTYLQLRKIVGTIQKQRKQGESENFLLFTKDQSSSKLISQLALKTIAFLVAVLLSIITTTNLITYDTGIVLLVVIIPFIIACASILLLHYVIVKQKAKTQKKDIEVPFIDKEKICVKCGESTFQSDKFCGVCGAQLILPEKLGTYIARCTNCAALINDKAKHCPTCGKRI